MALNALQTAERLQGIGGSDAAAALGLSPWKSPLELYAQKTGEAQAMVDNEPVRWGTLLEPVIRQEYSNVTGRTVHLPTGTVRHKSLPWLLAHPDGFTDDARVFEAKAVGSTAGWGEPGTDQVPQHYLIQTIHYMGIMGLQAADIAVLFGGQRMAIYTVEFDAELWETMIEGEGLFWERVQQRRPPEPDWQSPRVLDVVRTLYRGTTGESVFATPTDEQYLAVMRDSRIRADRYNDAANSAKAHILYTMGDAAEMRFADGSVMRRRRTKRKAYQVEATEYVDARLFNPKKDTSND